MLSEKNELICNVLKAGLADFSLPEISDGDWDYLERELRNQAAAALPADVIGSHPAIEERRKNRWKGIAYSHAARWSQILYAQNELVQLMGQHQIQMVILKGTAAAMYYPIPEYRSMGDIDFLVQERDYQKALELMKENGYTQTDPKDKGEYHYSLEKNGIIFELHRKLAKLSDNKKGKMVTESVRNGLQHRVWRQIDGYQVPVLPWLPNGVVLLCHIRQHLVSGLGLRQIIDWMMYVEKELDDRKYPYFLEVIEKAGLEDLAIHVTKLCQKYLGLREEGISWCIGANEELCEELMGYIFQQGNFGQKVSWEGKGAKALSRSGIEQLRWMQKQGMRHWRAARRFPFWGCAAIFYELFRYIVYVMKKDKPIRSLYLDIKEGRRRRKMFKGLRVP